MTFDLFCSLTVSAGEFADRESFVAEHSVTIPADRLYDVYAYAHDRSVNAIRAMTGLSRAAFSRTYRIPIRTLESWEAGVRACPAYVLDLLAYAVINRERG